MRDQDQVKMEFLLTLNENIVVQRFFNVRGYNPKARVSTDLYEYMYTVKEVLHNYLRMKTVVYMLDNKDAIAYDANVMNTLTDIFSKHDLNHEYCGIELV